MCVLTIALPGQFLAQRARVRHELGRLLGMCFGLIFSVLVFPLSIVIQLLFENTEVGFGHLDGCAQM